MSEAVRSALIMAGGTGGHVYPALAVAHALQGNGYRIAWLGTKAGLEARVIPPHGFAMEWVSFAGLRGKGWLRALLLPANLLIAFAQSVRAILRQRPDVVIGFGGYATFPGGMMAVLLNRPLVVHEQNSVAGLANRVLALLADRVLAGFPHAFEQPLQGGLARALPRPKAPQWSGNPVRNDIAQTPAPDERYMARTGKLQLLVIGGSLGAQALNETVPQALALLPESNRPAVTHQAGEKNLEQLRAAYAGAGVQAEIAAFLNDMAARYAACDVIVCRAGALTVAEIAAAGVASVLVPYPRAVDDHQTGNAKFLSDAGAAVLLPQSELSAKRLADLLLSFTRERLLDMARKARALAKPDATRIVAQACAELVHAA